MPNTVPHQKIIHINKESVDKNFLTISKENWYNANKDLEPYGLVLYLYLAGNKDGYDLALSQEAAEEAGIKKTSFHKYVNVLIEKGYLVQKSGNIYDFYEKPHKEINKENAVPPSEQYSSQSEQDSLAHEFWNLPDEQNSSQSNKEINNIYPEKNNKKYNKEFHF